MKTRCTPENRKADPLCLRNSRRRLAAAVVLGALAWTATPSLYGDGVTILTHGYNPSVASSPLWMDALRNDLAANFADGEQLYGTITVTGSTNALTATCSPWNYDLSAATNAEVMIVVDWSAVADHLTKYVTAQSVASAVVARIVASQNGRPALAELPIHLIGHSRGGGMVCEIARQLGEQGIVVDHLTPLDPHPLTTSDTQPLDPPLGPGAIIDTPAAIYQNVAFADTYYQTASNPVGEYLAGAYNRHWATALAGGYHDNGSPTNVYPDHRNVLLLYQATANPADPLSNDEASMGATERAAWFNAYEASGTNTGFIYSRLGAGDRTSTNTPVDGDDAVRAGLNGDAAFGGGGARSNLAWSAATWPNVAALDVLDDGEALGSGTHLIAIGATRQVRCVYLDYDSGCTVTLRLDADRNPYNSNDVAIISTQVFAAATGASYVEHTADWNTAGLAEGTAGYVCAAVTDGTHTRYFYAPPRLLLGGDHAPVAGFGTSLFFSSQYEYVQIPDSSALDLTNSYTIECWFNAGSFYSLRGLVSKYQCSGAHGMVLRLTENDLDVDQMTTSGLNLQTGRWYHVAAVNDGGTRHLYVDGVEQTLYGTPQTLLANTNSLFIGSDYSLRFFRGEIDEVRIWNAALSETVITNWTFREVDSTHPALSNLVAYYTLNENSGTNATDSAGTHNGIMVNMAGDEWRDSTAGRKYFVPFGQTVTEFLPGSDEDGSSDDGADWNLSFEILDSGTYGTATVASVNAFTYTAPCTAGISDSFTYRVRDPSNEVSNVSTVTLRVVEADPFVDITNADDSVSAYVTTYTIGGTNYIVAGTMGWTNALTGSSGTMTATSPWTIADLDLASGTNVITVAGTNYAGTAASDTVTIIRRIDAGDGSPFHYVWTNSPAPAWPYMNWKAAAHTIQEAMDAAYTGDVVLVTNGVYDTGSVVTPGYALTNRVYITSDIELRSVNGPSNTFIVGAGPTGSNAVRCVYMTAGTLAGFTLTNGCTLTSGNTFFDRSGGEAFLYEGGTISNCLLTGGDANKYGGGACCVMGGTLERCTVTGGAAHSTDAGGGGIMCLAGGTLNHCRIDGNASDYNGGGVYCNYGGALHNCLITGNAADWNGGGAICAQGGSLNNCTIAGNTAISGGSGAYLMSSGVVENCIVYGNTGTASDEISLSGNSNTVRFTCSPGLSGDGNVDADPLFMDDEYRIGSCSPCVDAGTNEAWMADATDLAGRDRILDGTVDMGAYEYPAGFITITNTTTLMVDTASVVLGGTNSADMTGMLYYTNAATGASGSFASAAAWSSPVISLVYGTNLITVTGTNGAGDLVWSSIAITREPSATYVATGGGNVWPYVSWADAATTIQLAVNAVTVGGTVWVTNGVYDVGGTVPHGQDFTNRVVITRDITVRSVNGPSNTFIVGASDSGTNGPLAARCVWISQGLLTGFTITNGHTQTSNDWGYYQRGGGVFFNHGGTVSNCVISGNSANITGGGVDFQYGGTVVDCIIEGNTTTLNYGGGGVNLHRGALLDRCIVRNNASAGGGGDGGGLYFYSGGTARNCLITNNAASSGDGGGVYMGWNCSNAVLESCTLAGNGAVNGGGLYVRNYTNTVRNCILYGNSATSSGANWAVHGDAADSAVSYTCTTPLTGLPGGEGCLTNNPLFAGSGDYHLQAGSPCVNAGIYETWMDAGGDLDGESRFLGPSVDLGCYERATSSNALLVVAGINGVPLSNGAAASFPNGTDFGARQQEDSAITNRLALHNGGTNTLFITSWTNTGAGAAAFTFPDEWPTEIAPGESAALPVRFDLATPGSYTSMLSIANSTDVSPFVIRLAGQVGSWSPVYGPITGGNTVTITNLDFAAVTNVLIGGVPASIVSSGAGWVTFTVPAGLEFGLQYVVLQTTDWGDLTLPDAYMVKWAGTIMEDYYYDTWDRWTEVKGLPNSRRNMGVGVLNGALYAIGGKNYEAYTNVYRFDGTNWTQVRGLPKKRMDMGTAVLNDKLYVIGGGTNDVAVSTNVYCFDGTNWTEVAGLPQALREFPAATYNGAIYTMGGYNWGVYTNVYRFDGTSWTEVQGLPHQLYQQAAGTLSNGMYCVGGWTLDYAYRYDGTNWTRIDDLPEPRENAAAGVLSNNLYIIGGYDSGAKTNVYRYDGTNWTEVAGLPAKRYYLGGGVLNDVLYAIAGNPSASAVTNVYRYPGQLLALGVDPVGGSIAGGYTVTISGSNLCSGADVTNVTLCGVPVASIDSQNATQIVVTAGAAPFGSCGDVAIYSANYFVPAKTNAFTYQGAGISILGTNGAVVASDASASAALGTDFDHVQSGNAKTNTLSITNTGNATLTISGWTTNGPDAKSFLVTGLPSTLSRGATQTFKAIYVPGQSGTHQASLLIENNVSNYTVNLGGSSWSSSPTNAGPLAGGNVLTITNGLLGSGSDITNVLVGGFAASLVAQGANWVTITLPTIGSTGTVDVVVQSASLGSATLPNAYRINPAGFIGDNPLEHWTEIAGLPAPRDNLAVGVLNNALYAMGGYDDDYRTNVYRFNGTSWTEVAGLPSEHGGLATATLNDQLYAIGGYPGMTNVYRFDGTNWSSFARLPDLRDNLAAATFNGAIYAIGGADNGGGVQTNVYRCNGTSWTQVRGLPAKRDHLGAVVLNDALYAVGGTAGNPGETNVYRYNGTSWSETVGLPAERRDLAAGVLDGSIYAIGGGEYVGDVQSTVYRCDGTNWTQAPSLPAARSQLAAGVLDDILYAIGGYDSNDVVQTNVYRYPGVAQSTGVSPESGSHTGGYEVVIWGTNLCDGADITNVTLCGADAASIVSQSATQVVVTAGTGVTAGWGDVAVYSLSYGETLKTNVFLYNPAITVTPATNGTIAPDGVVELDYGGSTSLVVTADTYFHIGSLATNGAPVSAAAGQAAYTSVWVHVTNLATLEAVFSADLAAQGTPYWWLAEYGLTNNGASFDEAETNDLDFDTFNANAEYIADTIPTNGNSYLRVTNIAHDSSVVAHFGSSSNRLYTLEGASNLVTGAWTDVPGAGPRPGAGGADALQDTNEPAVGPFYRLKVKLP